MIKDILSIEVYKISNGIFVADCLINDKKYQGYGDDIIHAINESLKQVFPACGENNVIISMNGDIQEVRKSNPDITVEIRDFNTEYLSQEELESLNSNVYGKYIRKEY